ncbi:MarR family winged helix-turn-helix transcriptional regulator [Candidatus Formimonas warabiya]|uniref:TrmB family transcriptional regulator n=1 Tax=Formimonas warabiya TaxID=1761012 RepID=A0A3G1L0P8_FORW1|nr:MarR family transcriptional regulator [Candidatus Formimonas warabiya]ATW28240.1 TrmB family transcriptional regulator [Candidatus Formimonas warabiya]
MEQAEPLEQSKKIGKLFMEVTKLFRHNMSKSLGDIGMTGPQSRIIHTLCRFEKIKVSGLSRMVSLSNATVSGILDRLEKQGLVERTRSNEDKRVVYVSLTPRFKEIHEDFHRRSDEYFVNMINKGTPDDLNKIIEGLETLKGLLST